MNIKTAYGLNDSTLFNGSQVFCRWSLGYQISLSPQHYKVRTKTAEVHILEGSIIRFLGFATTLLAPKAPIYPCISDDAIVSVAMPNYSTRCIEVLDFCIFQQAPYLYSFTFVLFSLSKESTCQATTKVTSCFCSFREPEVYQSCRQTSQVAKVWVLWLLLEWQMIAPRKY